MEIFMTIHSSEQAAELWAGQLNMGGAKTEIKGPLSYVSIANHVPAPAQNVATMGQGPYWLVTAFK